LINFDSNTKYKTKAIAKAKIPETNKAICIGLGLRIILVELLIG
jgi:hypothetical protein